MRKFRASIRSSPGRHSAGDITRGKTARNRLRSVDSFLLKYDSNLLESDFDSGETPDYTALNSGLVNSGEVFSFERTNSFVVDLGFGQTPVTTLQTSRLFRNINPELPFLGVEIDPQRVKEAMKFCDELTFFRLGGFDFPLFEQKSGDPGSGFRESVRLIRAMNVLRQYDEKDYKPAVSLMASRIVNGGLIIEGTSDPQGRLWTLNLFRRHGTSQATLKWEAMVFGTNFRQPLQMQDFRSVLPKMLIHRVLPGQGIHHLFNDLTEAEKGVRGQLVWGPRQWFLSVADKMGLEKRFASRGFLLFRRNAIVKYGLISLMPDITVI
ncbi:MAG: hypothetical protein CVV64_09975 [Candidatus Wallbacteria bacterium HGW-Wallbacteria-1]|uniref:Methylase n=1 Tax=Candidatus Wallbacteria bacterium HGW-Wallbacteria-1 TaxID=2013854 RepID=A0A2N1PPM7_9BACT|nr:MAG: hypothetical protein CVV64_09975 [Candidatus Wallbacteria bacterium HGW-Wallbacteria-1]